MTIKKIIESQIGNGVILGTPIINENFAELEARLVALEPAVAIAAASTESANAKGQATATTAQDKTPGNSEFGHSHNNHGHNK